MINGRAWTSTVSNANPVRFRDEGMQGHAFDMLQRRCHRLRGVLRRLQWPQITHLLASGQEHELPLKAGDADAARRKPLSAAELQYLIGFFDGDGCVSVRTCRSSCTLAITQSFDRGEAILLFRAAFGGGIYMRGAGLGSRKPCVQWTVSGQAGKQAAMLLSQWPSMKQAQLHIAANWPKCPKARAEQTASLKPLKHHLYKPMQVACSWQYLSGFFDAEGYIKVPVHSPSVNLSLGQKNRHALDSIYSFLYVEQQGKWSTVLKSAEDSMHVLNCSNSAGSRQALTQFLSAGLLVKRGEAELALSLDNSNHMEVREGLSQMSGNQSKHSRLDAKGVLRDIQIRRLSGVARRAKLRGSCELAVGHELQLRELRQTHGVERMRSRMVALRTDIRSLLKSGANLAQVTSADEQRKRVIK
ncbi:unnamed protein product [Polarella glacialis]|uniref:LAGLIDADG endonuclease n=1 Tax=Polarella glacialis TaxID=89957 RepID=A0A813KC60_POLGL|nr:unnamed protein product [Polarella glacialis]